ncbi:anti-sigma factor [Agromyces mariniharenae]|uniref:Regulator of SigK n=1 Tax=Agromyces mariniharenae TaxID=2604423 RepID=A0A5S4V941_9MICO|nr:anti-sigma factor [Agromyces mariniharenae]TYL54393.1 anti-sigma factor [Agromyces mariniharenae]
MTDRDDDLDRERRDAASAGRPASIEAFHGLAAAYALDALDADERADFERALEGSPDLRAEVDAFRASAAHLAEEVEPVPPPPSLRDRLMADVATSPQVGSTDAATSVAADADAARAVSAGPAESAARRRWFQRPGAVIAAAAAAVLLVVGGVIGVGWPGPNGWGAQRERAAIAAAPDAQSQTLEVEGGGEVTLVSSAEQGRSVVVTEGLPELGADQTYELWYIDDSGAAPAGTFDVSGDETWRVLEGSFTPGVVVGITVEPAGGSPQPTTEPIVAIET